VGERTRGTRRNLQHVTEDRQHRAQHHHERGERPQRPSDQPYR
jgi:hypothetical protein